jgi:transposase
VFSRIFAALAGEGRKPDRIMIDATHLKAPRTAASLLKRGCSPTYRTHQGRPELEAPRRLQRRRQPPHPATQRRPDERPQRGTSCPRRAPASRTLIGDRGYDSNWFRQALFDRGIEPCIPPTRSRKHALAYDKAIYRQRHRIENMFAKLKDWRRIATRYDRCAHTFFSAICIAAAVAFYLNQ